MTNPNGTSEEQQALFDHPRTGREQTCRTTSDGGQRRDHMNDPSSRRERTRNSMLWAAYGDALGFVSELVGERMLKRRIGGAALDRLLAWDRKVGGRTGVMVRLPAGCWSDDTQLRMAASRAIDHHGFDVDAFARIEVPVWPSYALGGGRASKAAAKKLGGRTTWYANTFPGWSEAGGNGAAMRIQPHVWSSPNRNSEYLEDVIVDSVCTHGHLRAIVGACFHAVSLAYCMESGRVPSLDRCDDIAIQLEDAVELIEAHRDLGATWIGLWQQATGQTLRVEWKATVSELRSALELVADDRNGPDSTNGRYGGIADRLGLRHRHQRGSGILTTVAAVALARIAPGAHEAIVTAANALGTDTDTIGTMAGALLGACDGVGEPPEEVLDRAYLIEEADRLAAISEGQEVKGHAYPDIVNWSAPKVQADALLSDNGSLMVEGLGTVAEIDEPPKWDASNKFGWQWVQTEFGQTLLIKRRQDLKSPDSENSLSPPSDPLKTKHSNGATSQPIVSDEQRRVAPHPRPLEIDLAIDHARRHIADNEQVGLTVREVAWRGTRDQYLAVVMSLYDDLRDTPPERRHRSNTPNH